MISTQRVPTPHLPALRSPRSCINEFFLHMGLGIYFYQLEQPIWTLISILILAGSILVSYVKDHATLRPADPEFLTQQDVDIKL